MPGERNPPPRPTIPLALYCLASALATQQLMLHLAGSASTERLHALALCLGAGAAVMASLLFLGLGSGRCSTRAGRPGPNGTPVSIPGRNTGHALLVTLLTVACCSAVAGSGATAQAEHGAEVANTLASSSVSSWELVVASDPTSTQTGYRCRCRLRRNTAEMGDFWLTGKERLSFGDTITCIGRFKPLQNDDWGDVCRRQGVWGSITCVRVTSRQPASGFVGLLMRLRERVSTSFDPGSADSRALLDACITGTRDAMAERGTDKLFRTCGVSHLVAVSGGHLAVVASVMGSLLECLGLGPRARATALLITTGLFVVFCAAPVSAVRAWVMVALSVGAMLVGRRGHGLSSVCAVGLVMALSNPALSGQLGFVLSVSSVVGLCSLSGYASYALQVLTPLPKLHGRLGRKTAKVRGRLWRGMCDALGATFVAQAATAPFTARSFGDLSLVAPLANLALGPLFTAIVSLGLVAACCVGLPRLQEIVLLGADVVGGLALSVLRALASLPHACLSLGDAAMIPALAGVGAMAFILVRWPRVRPRLVWGAITVLTAGVAVVLIRWRWFAPARICVLDVGQGDAILVQDGPSALLVDAGPEGAVAQALLKEHVLHLDAVSITHLHDDHYGGVADLVGNVPCGEVFVGAGARENEPAQLAQSIHELTGHDSAELRYGDVLKVGGFELRVVSPAEEASGKENGDSLIMTVSYQGKGGSLSALLTGDAEEQEIAEVIKRGDVGDIDLLKVGHHGSEVSLTKEQAAALDPEVSVASAGEGNSYGHPRKECVNALTQAGSWFLCTKDVGTVEIRPAPEGVRVICDRG